MRQLKRVEQPESMSNGVVQVFQALRQPGVLWATIRDYIGIGRRRRLDPITDREGLQRFLNARASHVAQTSLYGYIRTRAGMRYPELFNDDGFVGSINVAKWQMWLACLSDIAVYAGGMLAREAPQAVPQVARLVRDAVADILAETGQPADAGPAFAESARAVLDRIDACDWLAVPDDAGAFTESPPALVRWAPIVDELKELDEPIVLNSVRFRWQEVRRDLRQTLDPAAVLGGGVAGAIEGAAEPRMAAS